MEKKSPAEVTITAVIMARTASTRCPQKNIRPFAGTTIIDIALEKLNVMDFVDDRMFAVAEEIFFDKAAKYPNVRIYERSAASIEKGHAPLKIRYEHFYDIKTDFVLFMNPCHPLLSIETLKSAVDIVRENQFNSFTSVIPSNDWIFDAEGNPITHKNPTKTGTNQTSPMTKAAHAFHFYRPENIEKYGYHWTLTKNDPALIEIPVEESIDIDTELDFVIAELYYKHKIGS